MIDTRYNDMEMLSFGHMAAEGNISHFITTRHGGVSETSYGSFNLGVFSGDKPERVTENRSRLCDLLGIDVQRLLLPYQTHGMEIARIDAGFEKLTSEQQTDYLSGKDALITSLTGYGIGVTTADCVPILLYDNRLQVIAAIHAGWRGTVARLVQRCIAEMLSVYGTHPQDILAGIGPSIGIESFEVGDEVVAEFALAGFDLDALSYRSPRSGKTHIDLWEANRWLLLQSGVPDSRIEIAGLCTYTHHDRFFSARRLGIASGRLVSVILLK